MARQKRQMRNIANCVPRPLVGHEVDEESGIVKLLVPRFRAGWMQWLQKRLKNPYIRVGLDEVGSAAWLFIDGKRTVLEIGEEMVRKFGNEKMDPVNERLGLFFGTLKRNRFVEWDDAAAIPAPEEQPEEKPIEPR